MYKKVITILLSFALISCAYSQDYIIDCFLKAKGEILTGMTTTERDALSTSGMFVFDNIADKFSYRNATAWKYLSIEGHTHVPSEVGLANVNNTSDANKPVSTAQQTALDGKVNTNALSAYVTILEASGSHTAGKVAGTYAMGDGDPLAVSGTGTLYPVKAIYIASADYPTINSLAPKLRIRAQLYVNDVAPTGNFTFGLYPITRPATSGAAGLDIYTLGTVVSGSNGATFTAPAADGLLNAVGSDFALPADGHYVIGVVTTATVATSSHLHMTAYLQLRNN